MSNLVQSDCQNDNDCAWDTDTSTCESLENDDQNQTDNEVLGSFTNTGIPVDCSGLFIKLWISSYLILVLMECLLKMPFQNLNILSILNDFQGIYIIGEGVAASWHPELGGW